MLPIARNGWTDWAEICWDTQGWLKSVFFSKLFFYRQRRALQLVVYIHVRTIGSLYTGLNGW